MEHCQPVFGNGAKRLQVWYISRLHLARASHDLHARTGAYGRLDMNAVFPTTVTNAGPTAKQSRCLHPDVRLSFVLSSSKLMISQSHRMLTIREFARSQGFPDSFEFVSLKDKVITVCIFSLSGTTEAYRLFCVDTKANRQRRAPSTSQRSWTRTPGSTFSEMEARSGGRHRDRR